MALTLVIRNTKTTIDTLVLDASLSEKHGAEVEVTEHPVEEGADISDHRRVKPRQITIEGIVSNTPVPDASAPAVPVTAFGVTWLSRSTGDGTRASDALDKLEKLVESDVLIDIVTSLTAYENMTLVNVDIPRDASSGQALKFTATFREIRFASNEVVGIQAVKNAKTTSAIPQADQHKKTPVLDPNQTPALQLENQLQQNGQVSGYYNFVSNGGLTGLLH